MTPPRDPRTPCPPDPPSRTSSSCPCRSLPPGSTAVTSVGLGELPQAQIQIQAQAHPQAQNSPYGTNHAPGAQLAVVNLTKSFAAQHPSGIEVEDLTLRSILATIHNLLPQVDEVQFLIDGQPADTLAGASDLTRPYAVQDPAKSIHVLSPDGNPI